MKYSKLELPFLSGEVIGENLDEMLEEIEKIVKKFLYLAKRKMTAFCHFPFLKLNSLS